MIMTQEDRWITRYEEVKTFVETNKRNPSKHRLEEHDMLNWLKANRKLLNAGIEEKLLVRLYENHDYQLKQLLEG